MTRFTELLPSPRRLLMGALVSAAFNSSMLAAASPEPAAAGPEANKAVVVRVIEEIQRDGKFENFERLFAVDYEDHTAFPGFARDRNGTRTIYETFRRAFPGFRATIHRQVAEGDLVTTHKTYRGTHLGDFNGIAPTGRAITFDVIDIMRVRNGQITDHWGVADVAGLIAQITQK
jgi:predicted SnoaL-like aldol condensation-catalyzing enzyme